MWAFSWLPQLSVYDPADPPELLITFDSGAPELVPDPSALEVALNWLQDPSVTAIDRVTFYSADEAPVAPVERKARPKLHLSRADMAAAAAPTGTATDGENSAKLKKPGG